MTHKVQGLKRLWAFLRDISGDSAYERYLEHCAGLRGSGIKPLSRRDFEAERQNRRWSRPSRCC